MSFSTDWDVNKYFDETEPVHHWEMRKNFMITHKEKFPEQRLVCLSKVFCNVEFIGCSYNSELMTLIKHLATEIKCYNIYKIQTEQKLKRTFVQASDAVKKPKQIKTDHIVTKKEQKIDVSNKKPSILSASDRELLQRVKSQPGWKGKLILFEQENQTAFGNCLDAARRVGITCLVVKGQQEPSLGKFEYALELNNENVMSCFAINAKQARMTLGEMVYPLLKKYCFSILVTGNKFDGESVAKDFKPVTESSIKIAEQPELPHDNIGTKMMKLMGWAGQGLGKNEHGIQTPIEASKNIKRSGFGTAQSKEFKDKIRQFLREYISSDKTHNLIFAKDFSKVERGAIHEVAQQLRLKSKSYGKDEDRQLTVSRKLSPWDIVEELMAAGGSSSNYTLIPPTSV